MHPFPKPVNLRLRRRLEHHHQRQTPRLPLQLAHECRHILDHIQHMAAQNHIRRRHIRLHPSRLHHLDADTRLRRRFPQHRTHTGRRLHRRHRAARQRQRQSQPPPARPHIQQRIIRPQIPPQPLHQNIPNPPRIRLKLPRIIRPMIPRPRPPHPIRLPMLRPHHRPPIRNRAHTNPQSGNTGIIPYYTPTLGTPPRNPLPLVGQIEIPLGGS